MVALHFCLGIFYNLYFIFKVLQYIMKCAVQSRLLYHKQYVMDLCTFINLKCDHHYCILHHLSHLYVTVKNDEKWINDCHI